MTTLKPVASADDASDLVSSLMSILPSKHRSYPESRHHVPPKTARSRHIGSISSFASETSLGSSNSSAIRTSPLSSAQTERFQQCVEREYDSLLKSEAGHCCYINDSSRKARANEELLHSANGTYFVRPACDENNKENVEYCLHFVCHKEIVELPICCDKEHREFWFLSGCGHGSEVTRIYGGIDVLIQHKTQNNFFELQYPFRISLYKPLASSIVPCTPLPDEVRANGGRHTILHELATHGLSQYFNELIRRSRYDGDSLREKYLVVANKINGRNPSGKTPLILTVQASKYDFVELLLDNKAHVNLADGEGCSPLHYACRQANARILKKLIDRQADPHYINPRSTKDGTNLSAFHYLAMSAGAPSRNIKRCVIHLLACGCPLMPLTQEGKTPFDVAEACNNQAYVSVVTPFCARNEFNNLAPMDVSSSNEAKRSLANLAFPKFMRKFPFIGERFDNRDCLGCDGLFLIYRKKPTKSQPNGELGLCLHYNGQIFVYTISQEYQSTVLDPVGARKMTYKYCLVPANSSGSQRSISLFKSCEELIYSHTKYQGILPTRLKVFVRRDKEGIVTIEANKLLMPNNQRSSLTDGDEDPTDMGGISGDPFELDVTTIDSFDITSIEKMTLLTENHRRFIWLAYVRYEDSVSFPIVIKDYLPTSDVESFKLLRESEFNPSAQHHRSVANKDDFPYEFSARARLEYKHESNLLRKKLNNHPFIVHTFLCEGHLKRDLRLFMEYLPCGNLHSYLSRLSADSVDPLINAFHWIYQLAQVMAYLARKQIVHRDLAARNILMCDDSYIKLSDFGLSRSTQSPKEENDCILPLRWTAPECFDRDHKLSSSTDIWSFAVVIWEIYSFGAVPYNAEIKNDTHQLARQLKRFLVEKGRRLSRPAACTESMYDLMYCCWNEDANKRPQFVDIIHDFNATAAIKDRLVPYTREERAAWKKANEKYLELNRASQPPMSGLDNGYGNVHDCEDDDNVSLQTFL